jgi:hypothetical protein
MSYISSLRHEFVEFIPDVLEEGTLYVTLKLATAIHRCACGCGQEVVTPLSPQDWSMKYDGETISMWPSIGNWSFPCRSHYWIVKNRIRPARRWSQAEVEIARKAGKKRHGDGQGQGSIDRMG